jgi:hypothetical protein
MPADSKRIRKYRLILWVLIIAALFISCNLPSVIELKTEETLLNSSPSRTPGLLPPLATSSLAYPTSTPDPSSTPTLKPSLTSTPWEPLGCEKPPDDYSIININGSLLNARTLAMLQHAYTLYNGEIDITNSAITQGSYTNAESASFGTHDGGGAVDLSVMRSGTYTVLYDDIEPLIHALRVAGFAAWLRDFNDLYPGSPIHIHAIAIGDEQLSQAAYQQLMGEAGYFFGFDGLPVEAGDQPAQDKFGGPVLCQWMIDRGYTQKP